MITTAPATPAIAIGPHSAPRPRVAAAASAGAAGRHRRRRARTLHLMDLENLLAGRVDCPAVAGLWHDYQRVTDFRWDDHVIVAVSKKNAAATFFALPAAIQRIVGRNIPDGADLALIEAVDIDWAARRFGQVMVATGDGIFTDTARRLHERGLQVVQVLGGGLPSARLYRQCSTQLYLPTTGAGVESSHAA